ncbi:Gfo/Idh/MocA family oxidoreductase [Aurantimonas sp. MSK8Z-1]|uniref:Gfo/Idh/MocA family protein n=1 Tax=Mangrovibrevibacter kandeliae TaxID=2968473 RepID=UPI002230C245|nr:Gfo/Idh/MocA family oxidoreductase [Aurantimonas sp. MSK8Z-1]MCW4116892.1 Gfo/Idh/MocA family oxidoreductase [Aurantimonas sp. MSK8Z-1]
MQPKIGVIGCGQWGRNHIRTLSEIGALAAVADRDPERGAEFASRFGVPALSPDAAIETPDLDALVLALPAHLHGPTARRAFAAGKDVLIEKPIALDPADAEATAATAAASGRLLMVGHLLRFHPVFRALADAVQEGRIGAVRHISACRLGLGRFLGMDVVWDLAPHDISLVLEIAGSAVARVEAVRRTVLSDQTDAADIDLTFDNGVTAEIHVSRVSPYRDRRFSVIGSEGMITFDDLAPEGQRLALYAHRVWPQAGGFGFTNAEPEFLPVNGPMPLERELRHFIDCIASRREPDTGAADAVENVRILALASPRA